MRNRAWYSRFAKAAAHFCGRPPVFAIAVGLILVWMVTGPVFHFSDTSQHQHDNRHIPDGLPDSKHAESGHRGNSGQAR